MSKLFLSLTFKDGTDVTQHIGDYSESEQIDLLNDLTIYLDVNKNTVFWILVIVGDGFYIFPKKAA